MIVQEDLITMKACIYFKDVLFISVMDGFEWLSNYSPRIGNKKTDSILCTFYIHVALLKSTKPGEYTPRLCYISECTSLK